MSVFGKLREIEELAQGQRRGAFTVQSDAIAALLLIERLARVLQEILLSMPPEDQA